MGRGRGLGCAAVALIAALSCPSVAGAQSRTDAAPTPATQRRHGFDPERLARLDRFLQAAVDSNRIAGAVALVLRDGEPVYERAVGWADREAGRRMTPTAVFRLASQTKALTSVAIMQLIEQGQLALSDRVSRWIPSFAHTTVATKTDTGVAIVPARRAITIFDLLTHTAGIPYGYDALLRRFYAAQRLGTTAGPEGWYFADRDETMCAAMDRLAGAPFAAQPGERFVYGYGTDVLGCIVERITGQTLDAYIRAHITGPLGMEDTYFFLPVAKRDRLTAVYASDSTGHATRAPEGPAGQGMYVDGPHRAFAGGTGMLSTARDYARFLETLRRGGVLGGTRVLGRKTVELMTTDQIGTMYGRPGLGWSLAFETVNQFGANGMLSAGSYGWAGAYGSTYYVDPRERMVLVFMIQQYPDRSDVAAKFRTLVYQALVDSSG